MKHRNSKQIHDGKTPYYKGTCPVCKEVRVFKGMYKDSKPHCPKCGPQAFILSQMQGDEKITRHTKVETEEVKTDE